MKLSDKNTQLLKSNKLLSPKSRSTATPPRKVSRAVSHIINGLKTTNGFRATLLGAFLGFPLLAGLGDANASECKAHVPLACGETFTITVKTGHKDLTRDIKMVGEVFNAHFDVGGAQ